MFLWRVMVFNMSMIYYQNIYNDIHVGRMTPVMELIGLLLTSNHEHLHVHTYRYIYLHVYQGCY
jgi:hypothetical protein